MGRRAAVTGVLALLGGLVAALLELLPQGQDDGRNSRVPEVSVRGLRSQAWIKTGYASNPGPAGISERRLGGCRMQERTKYSYEHPRR